MSDGVPNRMAADTIHKVAGVFTDWMAMRGSSWSLVQETSGSPGDELILGARIDGVPLSISINRTP